MAAKVLNFKMDETEILDVKEVAAVFNLSVTDLIKTALSNYISELKADPYYRLTMLAEEASERETQEILAAVNDLSDDDLTIVSSKRFTV